MSIQAFVNIKQNFKIDTLLHRQPMKFFSKTEWHEAKKKTSLFPVAGLKIAMRNAVFYFYFFTIHEKAMRNAIFIFLNKTSGRKYIETIALVSFLTFNKNITSFI